MTTPQTPPETPASHHLTVSTETGAVLSHTVQMLGAAKSPVSESILSDHILLYICFFLYVYLGMCRVKAPFVAVDSVLLPYMFWKLS